MAKTKGTDPTDAQVTTVREDSIPETTELLEMSSTEEQRQDLIDFLKQWAAGKPERVIKNQVQVRLGELREIRARITHAERIVGDLL